MKIKVLLLAKTHGLIDQEMSSPHHSCSVLSDSLDKLILPLFEIFSIYHMAKDFSVYNFLVIIETML